MSVKEPYVCPPDAGPAWRAAYEAGVDMAELEENLKLTPGNVSKDFNACSTRTSRAKVFWKS